MQPIGMEDLERRLTVKRRKADCRTAGVDARRSISIAVRSEADRDLAPYRSKMTAPQIEQLHKQYVHKRLLEQYQVPRLSLFYM